MKKLRTRCGALLLAFVILMSMTVPALAASYDDLSGDSMYYESVQWASDCGVVKGMTPTSVGVDSVLTNGQFFVMLSRYFKYELPEDTSWQEEIRIRSNALVTDEVLQPWCLEKTADESTWAMVCYYALRSRGVMDFNTYDKVPMNNAVAYLQDIGLVPGSVLPADTLTRGEFLLFLHRFMQYDFSELSRQMFESAHGSYDLMHEHVVFDWEEMSEGTEQTAAEAIFGYHKKQAVYNALDMLPQEILEHFVGAGWHIVVGDATVNEYEKNYPFSIGGVTNYAKKEIAVRGWSSLNHEFGHFMQDYVEMMDGFGSYYREEKDAVKAWSPECDDVDNSHEYFAEMFRLYMNYVNTRGRGIVSYQAEQFREAAPKTWAFFEQLEANGWKA